MKRAAITLIQHTALLAVFAYLGILLAKGF